MSNRHRASAIELGTITCLGLALFLWPFFAAAAPPAAVAPGIVLATITVLVVVEAGTRRLDARMFALLATIAAVDAALRLLLVIGLEGFTPIFFLILVAGYVCGPSFGFLCGATSLLVSAVATGGIGAWLPYEAIACGWVGMIAGLAGLRRRDRVTWRDVAVLAAVGFIAGYAYGAVLDMWDWTVFYRGAATFGFNPGASPGVLAARFADFYVATSLLYDTFRAVGNALLVILLGPAVIAALQRLRSRFDVTVLPDAA